MFACQKALQGSDDLGELKDPGGAPLAWDGCQLAQEASLTLTTKSLLEQPSARHGVLGLLTRPVWLIHSGQVDTAMLKEGAGQDRPGEPQAPG